MVEFGQIRLMGGATNEDADIIAAEMINYDDKPSVVWKLSEDTIQKLLKPAKMANCQEPQWCYIFWICPCQAAEGYFGRRRIRHQEELYRSAIYALGSNIGNEAAIFVYMNATTSAASSGKDVKQLYLRDITNLNIDRAGTTNHICYSIENPDKIKVGVPLGHPMQAAHYIYTLGSHCNLITDPADVEEMFGILQEKYKAAKGTGVQQQTMGGAVSSIGKSIPDQILELNDLKNKGILSESEFESKKHEMMARM